MVKETSRDFLHMFSTLYINDIYLKTQEDHDVNVLQVPTKVA